MLVTDKTGIEVNAFDRYPGVFHRPKREQTVQASTEEPDGPAGTFLLIQV